MTQTQQTTAERISAYLTNALDLSLIGHGDTPTALSVVSSVIAAEIDALTRERDEAQRIIGIYNTSRDEVIAQLCEMNDALRDERDEARAEVERLRPAAEAWEARERYLNYEQYGATAEYRDAALRECHRKDVIARAAKERKP